ncbi:MAG TPA: hypothetical protein VIK77_08845 [Tissierellaceae bacterium]
MMRKIWSLIRTDLNVTYGLSSIAYRFKNNKNRWQIIVFGIAMLSLIPSYLLMVKSLDGMYDLYVLIGQKSMFLLTGFLLTQILIFFLGLLYVMSKYYFSNDLAQLIPLPIKPSYIIGSKFISLMISEYLTSLPIILPFIIIYGTKSDEGILYWIYSLLVTAFLPIIPLVLASIVVMIFMKYTNIRARKDLIRTVSAILFIILILYVQLKIQSIAQKSIIEGRDFILNLIKDSNLLVKKLGISFPPSQWASLSLANNHDLTGFVYLIIFIAVSIVIFVLMILLSEYVFLDGLIGNIEVSAEKGKGKKILESDLTKVTKPYMALAKKELIMLFKTPIYLINTVGGVIILPVVLVMTNVMGGEGSISSMIEMTGMGLDFITLGCIGFIVALGMLNCVGSTTFSREGKCFWIQRTLPIRVEDQIIGRLLSALAIQVIGIVAFLIGSAFIIKFDAISIILITLLGLLGSVPMTLLGMTIDILRPMLDWDNPQRAIKQNLNVLIGMGVGVLYVMGLGFLVYKVINKINIVLIYGLLGLIFIISSIILYVVLKALIKKQFEILE